MKKKILLSSAILLVALLITLSTSVYAWFNINTTVSVEELEISVETDKSLLITDDPTGSWYTSVNLSYVLDGKKISADVSGGASGTFYTIYGEHYSAENPILYQYAKSNKDVATGADFDFLELDLYFKAENPCNVYLSNQSSILPKEDPEGLLTLTGDTAYSKSDYGPFSKNYIAGAVRVGVWEVKEVEGVETEEFKFIWIPNQNYELINPSGTTQNYTFNPDGVLDPNQNYIASATDNGDGTFSSAVVSSYDADTIKYFNSNFTTGEATVASLVTLSDDARAHIIVRIWIEGTDRESHAALSGGDFITNLLFISENALGGG